MTHFEGPEKKLEIFLTEPQADLRGNADGRWTRVVKAGGAEILNRISTADLDGYLLSESSLFVWDDRLLMITCGQTTPVKALPEILQFVDREKIAFLFYERKNLNFPSEQATTVEDDFQFLAGHFAGQSLRFGSGDHDHVHVFYYGNGHPAPQRDATLRVLMHDIDPAVGRCFTQTRAHVGDVKRLLGNLSLLNRSLMFDTHFFNPQGYSLNALAAGDYLTVHVTPEPEASYTSLETNMAADGWRVINEITSMFNPARFSVFMKCGCDASTPEGLPLNVPGFGLEECDDRRLDGQFRAAFQSFRRNDGFT